MLSPNRFSAGETVTWEFSHPDYSSAEYTLVVNFGNASGFFQATSAADGAGGWDITLAAATTAEKAAGSYRYQVQVSKGSGETLERHVLERGSVELLPLLDGAEALDARSDDEIILDAIVATLKGRATSDQSSVSVDGTSISRMSLAELIEARDYFQRRVSRQRRRSRQTKVRF